ncbi:hypothetical protein PV797_20980 [Clostridiaceae bacterium M8S5]|nr:hypothetical protein PV797_20980 [Clostridiaceae bacterium M8S5]
MDNNLSYELNKLKKIDYRNSLVIASIIEVLIDKDILAREDIFLKSKELDKLAVNNINCSGLKKETISR